MSTVFGQGKESPVLQAGFDPGNAIIHTALQTPYLHPFTLYRVRLLPILLYTVKRTFMVQQTLITRTWVIPTYENNPLSTLSGGEVYSPLAAPKATRGEGEGDVFSRQKVRKCSLLSFPRRQESSLSKGFWTPAPRLPPSGTDFAGVTDWETFCEFIKFLKTY
jgi:hypothetical protein